MIDLLTKKQSSYEDDYAKRRANNEQEKRSKLKDEFCFDKDDDFKTFKSKLDKLIHVQELERSAKQVYDDYGKAKAMPQSS